MQFDVSKYWNLETGKVEFYFIGKNKIPYGVFTKNKKYIAEYTEDIVKYKGEHRICHIFEIIDDNGKSIPFSDNKNTNPNTRLYIHKYFVSVAKIRSLKLKKLKNEFTIN